MVKLADLNAMDICKKKNNSRESICHYFQKLSCIEKKRQFLSKDTINKRAMIDLKLAT
jgi:hypothetical protein